MSNGQTTIPLRRDLSSAASSRVLLGLAALAALAAGWAGYLWRQLVSARAGGPAFCGFGEGGNCTALWDGAFASAVHRYTGVPVAGWGVIWGLAALILALVALRGRSAGGGAEGAVAALKLTAVAGFAATVVFALVATQAGVWCTGCVTNYVLVTAFAALAWFGLRRVPDTPLSRGLGLAAGVTIVAFLALLWPGLQTSKGGAAATQAAVAQVTSATQSTAANLTPGELRERQLRELLGGLVPDWKQFFADSLAEFRAAKQVEMDAPRALVGGAAPVRVTTFSDPLCPHCADLHEELDQLRRVVPAGSVQLEERWYPLDATCNARVPRSRPDGLNCIAAKIAICLEGNPQAFEYSSAMFGEQEALTVDKAYQLAAGYGDAAAVGRCVKDQTTADKLAADIAWAAKHDIQGTPMVLVNGRKVPAVGQFLYALILAGGNPDHPAFQALPPSGRGAPRG